MAAGHQDGANERIPGAYAKQSPSGTAIAFIEDCKIRCSTISRPHLAHVNIPTTLRPSEITSVQWSDDEDKVLAVSTDGAEVFDISGIEKSAICRLANGSGGFGQLSTVNFISDRHLLSIWEFGKARVWDLESGNGDELPDVKTTCDASPWRIRPAGNDARPALMALLSRNGSEDHLSLLFPTQNKLLSTTRLPTVDAQNLSWSPDGHWLVVQDTPTSSPSLHILTPDGHPFRTYPPPAHSHSDPQNSQGLGIKTLAWSPDGTLLALAHHSSRINLLNARTFTLLLTIELPQVLDRHSFPSSPDRIPIFQETVTAAGTRSYATPPPPIPLSSNPRVQESSSPSPQLSSLGISSLRFSPRGNLLATHSHQLPSALWIHHIPSGRPAAVILQHRKVRRFAWHPSRPGLLLFECGEGVFYLFDAGASSATPPKIFATGLKAGAGLSWVSGHASPAGRAVILGAEKGGFRVIFPEGEPDWGSLEGDTVGRGVVRKGGGGEREVEGEGEGEGDDSLFEILSGRTPMPPRTEVSYTERLELEVGEEEAGETMGGGLEDTFRGKGGDFVLGKGEVDPLDDSEIF